MEKDAIVGGRGGGLEEAMVVGGEVLLALGELVWKDPVVVGRGACGCTS